MPSATKKNEKTSEKQAEQNHVSMFEEVMARLDLALDKLSLPQNVT